MKLQSFVLKLNPLNSVFLPDRMIALKELLETTFPIENCAHSAFRFFPICNESDFCKVIDDLSLVPSAKGQDQINVAILFGESHFLSLLPSLSRLVDLIILADIEEKLHAHNRHLLSTFRKAHTISKFLIDYCADFPTTPFQHKDTPNKETIYRQVDVLLGRKSQAFASVKQHHFLHSTKQYQSCKQALDNVSIVQICLNLADNEACLALANLLQRHQAQLAVCNFTNIHQYVEAALLHATTTNLLRYSKPDCILYSTGSTHHLTVHCTSKAGYLRILNVKPLEPTADQPISSYLPSFFKRITDVGTPPSDAPCNAAIL